MESSRLRLFQINRQISPAYLEELLAASWEEDSIETLVLIFHLRDCRGGKGQKAQFHLCLQWLIDHHLEDLQALFDLIWIYGSWKDYLFFFGTPLEERMIAFYTRQLMMDKLLMFSFERRTESKSLLGQPLRKGDQISLAAKWAPSEGSPYDKRYKAAEKFAQGLGGRKSYYRREFLVPLRKHLHLVETQLCQQEWDQIDFSRVPAKAMRKYNQTFNQHCPQRYQEFLAQRKIPPEQISPEQILKPYLSSIKEGICYARLDNSVESQWSRFISFWKEKWRQRDEGNSLALVDLSASPISLSRAIFFTLFIAEMNCGYFHQKWINFSSFPILHTLYGQSVQEKIRSLLNVYHNQHLNLQAIFDLLLTRAETLNLRSKEMPQRLFIYSDRLWKSLCLDEGDSNFDLIEEHYTAKGYSRPKIIFWNLQGDNFDLPADLPDFSWISGFNPALLDSYLQGDELNPLQIMRKTINSPRYDPIRERYKSN